MAQRPKSKLCNAGLVMGILCVCFALLPLPCFIFGLLGFIFSIVSLGKKKGSVAKGVWGLVLSIIGVLLRLTGGIVLAVLIVSGGVIGVTLLGMLIGVLSSMGMDNISDYLEELEYYDTTGYNSAVDDEYDNNTVYEDDTYKVYLKDDSWMYDYLTSGVSYTIDNFRFNVPQGMEDIGFTGENNVRRGLWYGNDMICFPGAIGFYDGDMYDGYAKVRKQNENDVATITWYDDEIHQWNDDWSQTSLEIVYNYEDGSTEYCYAVIAFSTHENVAIILQYFPEGNEFTEDVYVLQQLYKYIDYIG